MSRRENAEIVGSHVLELAEADRTLPRLGSRLNKFGRAFAAAAGTLRRDNDARQIDPESLPTIDEANEELREFYELLDRSRELRSFLQEQGIEHF